MGLANSKSIAWGIAKSAVDNGAEIALTYQGETLLKRVEPLAKDLNCTTIVECDVTDGDDVKKCFSTIEKEFGKIDFVVHAIAYSDKDELKGKYMDTSFDNFAMTMNISCYSFTTVCKYASEIMNDGGSFITLTYYGAEKVMPHYNVMGVAKAALETSVQYLAVDLGERRIRVNAISAGPIKTLAASGIGDFRYILKWNEDNAPLGENTTIEEVGGASTYLLSDLSKGTTGEVIHVDGGYHVIGMKSAQQVAKDLGKKEG